jgi:UDP-N-acetylmuramoyl-tripeptide--D-alanyl-D-alanine ligase
MIISELSIAGLLRLLGDTTLTARLPSQMLAFPARICTNTREIQPFDVFWALKGKNFDGNDFVEEAFAKGATVAITSRPFPTRPCLCVKDTLQTLQTLAHLYQHSFASMHKVAITGSNGKTTTKEYLAQVLATRYNTLATEGNYNNEIGVPLTLMRLQRDYRMAAVIEIGTNHPGEIAPLTQMVEPDIALITNIGESHLEGFGTQDAVFKEKLSITQGFVGHGILAVNADDPYLGKLKATKAYSLIRFGIRKGEIRPENLEWDKHGRAHFKLHRVAYKLQIPGLGALYSALGAIAVGLQLRVSSHQIAQAINHYKPQNMRMQVRKANGFSVIADCYNANPSSMRNALESLATMQCRGKKIAVLGDMLELGPQSAELHTGIGELARSLGISVLATGKQAKRIARAAHGKFFEEKQQLIDELKSNVQKGDIVLVKGSRGMRLESVVEALC